MPNRWVPRAPLCLLLVLGTVACAKAPPPNVNADGSPTAAPDKPVNLQVDSPAAHIHIRASRFSNVVGALNTQAYQDSWHSPAPLRLKVSFDDALVTEWVSLVKPPDSGDSSWTPQPTAAALRALVNYDGSAASKTALNTALASHDFLSVDHDAKPPSARKLAAADKRRARILEVIQIAGASPAFSAMWTTCAPSLRKAAAGYAERFGAPAAQKALGDIHTLFGATAPYETTIDLVCRLRGEDHFTPFAGRGIQNIQAEGGTAASQDLPYQFHKALRSWLEASPVYVATLAKLKATPGPAAAVTAELAESGGLVTGVLHGLFSQAVTPKLGGEWRKECCAEATPRDRVAHAIDAALVEALTEPAHAVDPERLAAAALGAVLPKPDGPVPPRLLMAQCIAFVDEDWEAAAETLLLPPDDVLAEGGGGGIVLETVHAKASESLRDVLLPNGLSPSTQGDRMLDLVFVRASTLPRVPTYTRRVTKADVDDIVRIAGTRKAFIYGVDSAHGPAYVFVAPDAAQAKALLAQFYKIEAVFKGPYNTP